MSCGKLRPLWMQPPSESEGLVWRSWTVGRGPFQAHTNHIVAKNCNRVRDEIEDRGTADGSSVRCMLGGYWGAFRRADLVPVYRVSQEECARLREGVPYVKVYRYNPKHLCPKLDGYGDNGQRKVWSSGGSTHCTCQLTTLSMSALECGVILRQFSSHSLQTVYVLLSW